MPIMLNSVLLEAGLNLSDIRMLRHQDQRSTKDRTPYRLWCENREQFDRYQKTQGVAHERKFRAPYWASFVGTPGDETLFVGLYAVGDHKLLAKDTPTPHMDGVDAAGSCHVYDLTLQPLLSDLIGKMLIDWGSGKRAWIQRPDRRNKQVVELRRQFKEEDFPGFINFVRPLSELNRLPTEWICALSSSKGVYLLTCPRTKEQYVGSATGDSGFWGRWQDYANGHGGNVKLTGREPSDYQVSILEVAGTAQTLTDILRAEQLWKSKLQSKEMGLNRN